MKGKYPILILIPHGGCQIPEELSDLTKLTPFDLLFESDICANEIFNFREKTLSVIDTSISRLFVDEARSHLDIPPGNEDGVIKSVTSQGREIFPDKVFPDEIALANILKRYYLPFHETAEKILATGTIRLLLECHTMMAVAPPGARDSGRPRPLLTISNRAVAGSGNIRACPEPLARSLLETMKKSLHDEDTTVAERFTFNKPVFRSYISEKYGTSQVPLIRIDLSRSLFFNDRYFSYEYLQVDELRIQEIRGKIWTGLEKFLSKNF